MFELHEGSWQRNDRNTIPSVEDQYSKYMRVPKTMVLQKFGFGHKVPRASSKRRPSSSTTTAQILLLAPVPTQPFEAVVALHHQILEPLLAHELGLQISKKSKHAKEIAMNTLYQ